MRWPWDVLAEAIRETGPVVEAIRECRPIPEEPAVVPKGPVLNCRSCGFEHMEPVNQVVQAHVEEGKPILVPSGFRLACSKCGSLHRLTAQGLALVLKAKAVEDDEDGGKTREGDDESIPDTDLRGGRRWYPKPVPRTG